MRHDLHPGGSDVVERNLSTDKNMGIMMERKEIGKGKEVAEKTVGEGREGGAEAMTIVKGGRRVRGQSTGRKVQADEPGREDARESGEERAGMTRIEKSDEVRHAARDGAERHGIVDRVPQADKNSNEGTDSNAELSVTAARGSAARGVTERSVMEERSDRGADADRERYERPDASERTDRAERTEVEREDGVRRHDEEVDSLSDEEGGEGPVITLRNEGEGGGKRKRAREWREYRSSRD